MNVGQRIKLYIAQNGITQSYISRKTGITEAKLSLALNGKRRMTFDEYEIICWALNVGVNAFLAPRAPDRHGA